MKNSIKKIAVLGLSLAVAGGVLALSACSDSEKEYTVKVTLPDGTAAFGTQVLLTGGKEQYCGVVDDHGYAKITAPEFTYGLAFENLPGAFIPDGMYSTSGQAVNVQLKMGENFSAFQGGKGEMFDRYEAACGTYTITVNSAEEEVFIALDPDSKGTYTFFTTGNVDTYVNGYDASFATCFPNESKNADNISSKNKNFKQTFEIGEVHYNEQWRESIGVMARSESYPVSFQLTFMKISDYYTPPTVYEHVIVETTEKLSKYPNAGKGFSLKPVDYDAEMVYNETDKFYHVGSADGPVAVVKLTTNPERLFVNDEGSDVTFQTVANPEYEGLPSTFYLTFQNADGSIHVRDYNKLITEIYPQYVNKDGVYGLTKELKEFLYAFIVDHENDVNIGVDVPREQRYLAPCYFYNEEEGTLEKPNVIDGETQFSIITPFFAESGATYYKLTAKGTFIICVTGNAKIIYEKDGEQTEAGSQDGSTIITVTVSDEGFVFGLTSFDGNMAWIDVIIELDQPDGEATA